MIFERGKILKPSSCTRRAVARGGGGQGQRAPEICTISHKNRENQGKWEEKGEIGKKMGSLPGSLPLRTGRASYGRVHGKSGEESQN